MKSRTVHIKAPREWCDKVTNSIKTIASKMHKKISKKSARNTAKGVWNGMPGKCKEKAIKKYGGK